MNILSFAYVDPSLFAATYTLKYSRHLADDTRRQDAPGSIQHDTQAIVLRGPEKPSAETWSADVEHVDYDLFGDWPASQELVARCAKELGVYAGGQPVHFGKIMVVSLKAGGFVDWHAETTEYAQRHTRFHLPVLPSCASVIYCGGEAMMPSVGSLTFLNNKVLHSEVNFGIVPRVHLVLDVRLPTKQ